MPQSQSSRLLLLLQLLLLQHTMHGNEVVNEPLPQFMSDAAAAAAACQDLNYDLSSVVLVNCSGSTQLKARET